MRISELLNLRLDDVDLSCGRLVIRGGKNDRDRVVLVTAPLSEALRRYGGPASRSAARRNRE